MAKRKRKGPKLPGYLHHKASGRAYVTLNGRRVYLGEHGSPESKARYEREIAEYLANGRRDKAAVKLTSPDGVALVVIIAAYWEHAQAYYRRADGTETGEASKNVRYALKPLRELYGDTPAAEFGPASLEALRIHLVGTGLARSTVNKRIGIVRRMMRWAESKEMVPRGTFHSLTTLEPLKAGRSEAKEPEKVRPVSWADVQETLKHLSPTIAAMVRLQWESACRPGEVCDLCAADIDRSNPDVWLYRPGQHKNKHRGKDRIIPLFARSQEILKPFLDDMSVAKDPTKPLFAPSSHRARNAAFTTVTYGRAIRRGVEAANAPTIQAAIIDAVTPLVPEDARERIAKSIRRLVTVLNEERITAAIVKQSTRLGFDDQLAIKAAVEALNCTAGPIEDWSPNQLRHAAATRIERELSVEEARIVLGHSSSRTSRNYIEPDVERAFDKLRKLG